VVGKVNLNFRTFIRFLVVSFGDLVGSGGFWADSGGFDCGSGYLVAFSGDRAVDSGDFIQFSGGLAFLTAWSAEENLRASDLGRFASVSNWCAGDRWLFTGDIPPDVGDIFSMQAILLNCGRSDPPMA